MKALTIWEPWASLIAVGAKPYEFRGWQAPRSLWGKRIAIHAGARPVRISEVRALIRALSGLAGTTEPCLHKAIALRFLVRVRNGLAEAEGLMFNELAPLRLPLSHVLCTAILGQPMRGDECAREFGRGAVADTGNDSDRDGTFNWGWPLTDIEPLLPPVPARGAQGLWNWSP